MNNAIREAISVLSRSGWTKDAFTDDSGRHCLQGALYQAHGLRPFDGRGVGVPLPPALAEDVRLVNEVIKDQFPERLGGIGVSRFNDHPDTDMADVLQVMEKAAVRRDEQV